MIAVQNLLVVKRPPRQILLSWVLQDTDENPLIYTFTVQHSNNDSLGFTDISIPLAFTIGNFIQKMEIGNELNQFYRIKIINTKTKEETYSKPQSYDKINDYVANAISYWEAIYLRNLIRRKTAVFFRMHEGQRCPNCWDNLLKRVTKTNCPLCFGTGYNGGYYGPLPSFFSVIAPVPLVQLPTADYHNSAIQGWTSIPPHLQNQDLIYSYGDSDFYRIIKTNTTKVRGMSLRYDLSLEAINKGEIVYSLLDRT